MRRPLSSPESSSIWVHCVNVARIYFPVCSENSSKNPTTPLTAVVGATGTQGGGVVKALAESDKAYRELAKLGVEVIAVSLLVENKYAIYKALAGADIAFLITNFWEHVNANREIAEGKLLIDAAKAGGVSRIVWSGLLSVTELSEGRYKHVYHFDSKDDVTAYTSQSGAPFVNLQACFYGTNFLTLPIMLTKQDDGSFDIPWPVKPTTVVPFIDTAEDYGLFVRSVLEQPVFTHGSEVLACCENISVQERSLATGKLSCSNRYPWSSSSRMSERWGCRRISCSIWLRGSSFTTRLDVSGSFSHRTKLLVRSQGNLPPPSPKAWQEARVG
ncbi:hypothetical protein DFH09DRAFT_1377681 [Mycena vulgaris]|nr:hypothetical protein DFH09DRAFT_1377681 [Mycena vulgaris]